MLGRDSSSLPRKPKAKLYPLLPTLRPEVIGTDSLPLHRDLPQTRSGCAEARTTESGSGERGWPCPDNVTMVRRKIDSAKRSLELFLGSADDVRVSELLYVGEGWKPTARGGH